jgi:hypothetical protein
MLPKWTWSNPNILVIDSVNVYLLCNVSTDWRQEYISKSHWLRVGNSRLSSFTSDFKMTQHNLLKSMTVTMYWLTVLRCDSGHSYSSNTSSSHQHLHLRSSTTPSLIYKVGQMKTIKNAYKDYLQYTDWMTKYTLYSTFLVFQRQGQAMLRLVGSRLDFWG